MLEIKYKTLMLIRIISLKDFTTGFKTKRVVNNLSLNFYENQVTGLLGYVHLNSSCIFIEIFNIILWLRHNGAGKTTTTFMLSGK